MDNVDCANTDQDLEEATFSKLCVVESKVDVIDFELGECCKTVNSKLDVIDVELGTVHSKVDVIDFELGECCVTVNSKLDVLLDPGCAPTAITGPTTITAAGQYCLSNNFDLPSGVGITVDASNVDLDLNNKTINGTGGANGVVIASGKSKVTIKNGTVCNMT